MERYFRFGVSCRVAAYLACAFFASCGDVSGSARTYCIGDFGASPGASARENALAVQRAIDVAARAGGGRVAVPAGEFTCGTLWLKRNVELYLEKGSVLKASGDVADYNAEDAYPENWGCPKTEYWRGLHFIIAREADGASITGPGTLHGNGDAFYDDEPKAYYSWMKPGASAWWNGIRWAKDKEKLRPGQMVAFIKCRNVSVSGITIRNSPCWALWFWGCDGVKVSDYTVRNGENDGNSDGIDIDCSRNVVLERLDIDTGDDAIAVRASARSMSANGRGRLGLPAVTENVRIRDCRLRSNSSVIRIGVGEGVIRDVEFDNVTCDRGGTGINISTLYGDAKTGGTDIEKIAFRNCHFTNCRSGATVRSNGGDHLEFGIRDVLFEDCSFGGRKPKVLSNPGVRYPVDPKEVRFVRVPEIEAVSSVAAAAENAAPADELARAKEKASADVPAAPPAYRRPAGWKPTLYPKGLHELAHDHAAETASRAARQMEKVDAVNAAGKWKATGASIDAHKCPEWFVDAKLGIFIDWGPWSVASWCPYVKGARLYPDWYEYRCRTDKATIAYHEKNWGADFKSDHFLDLFRGSKFDAPALMSVFKKCGAKYVVPFLKHHSGFCLWDCSYTFRDTVDMGAHRDFAREMADACRAEGLKFGFYDSQAGEWEYPILQEDGSVKIAVNRPDNLQPYSPDMEWKASGKVAVKDFVRDYIVPQATEFIDRYDPDIFWGDYDWMTSAEANGSYDIVAYLYNHAEGRKEVAANDRLGKARPEEIVGRFTKRPRSWLRTVRGDFYTDEWGDTEECLDPAKWHPWESCSGISKAYGNHWMESEDPGMVMSEREFVMHFSDIVARGGNLLLLVNLDPQGEIPAVQRERLLQIGKWLERWGEAIYGTRILAPFCTKAVDYVQSKDGRYAYAIVKESAAEVSLACALPQGSKVTVLGSDVPLATRREGTNTVVSIPDAFAASNIPFVIKGTLR